MIAENKKREAPKSRQPKTVLLIALALVVAGSTAVIAGLLVNIFQRKQEAKNPYLRFVDVTSDTTDPAEWGKNWPREYDSYLRTVAPRARSTAEARRRRACCRLRRQKRAHG